MDAGQDEVVEEEVVPRGRLAVKDELAVVHDLRAANAMPNAAAATNARGAVVVFPSPTARTPMTTKSEAVSSSRVMTTPAPGDRAPWADANVPGSLPR